MLFSAISGHTELKSTLIKNMNNGRIAHSLLFAGPEGCGSLALALAYARYLRCDAPVSFTHLTLPKILRRLLVGLSVYRNILYNIQINTPLISL